MLLLGHAAVSARRGPRGTCQKTRAALWAPAECGVTARSASDGVDANGIRVRHRRLQLRRYQCGMFRRETPSRPPGSPAFTALKSAGGERGCWGYVSRTLFRALRERRVTVGWVGNVVVAAADPRYKLPLAYLRESLPVLDLELLFQGGVKFPTGGKSDGARGAPWRRRGTCVRADESATRACVGSHVG